MKRNLTVSKIPLSFRCAHGQVRGVDGGICNSPVATQRNLNNAFAYDLVPSPTVIVAALRAARRVNDFPTAVRIFEGSTVPTFPMAQYYGNGTVGTTGKSRRPLILLFCRDQTQSRE